MSTRTFATRSVAILASAGTAATLALLPSAGHAAVHVSYLAAANSTVSYIGPTSGGSCALTGDGSVTSTTTNFTHGTKHKNAAIKAHYTSSDNSADRTTIKGSISSTMTLKKVNNDLSVFDLKTGGSLDDHPRRLRLGLQGLGRGRRRDHLQPVHREEEGDVHPDA